MRLARNEDLLAIWNQKKVPILLRLGKGYDLRFRLPFHPNNREWLRNGRQRKPRWLTSKFRWELPQAWFDDLIESTLKRFGAIYVIQPYTSKEVCAPNCWNALGNICECSCMGQYHGTNAPGDRWYVVSDTFAVNWGERRLGCRLLRRK